MGSNTPIERRTTLASYFMCAGIVTGWLTCSLFWIWMGWLS